MLPHQGEEPDPALADPEIGLFSYDGGLYWGLNADWEALPDLHDLVGYLAEDFEALRKAAQV